MKQNIFGSNKYLFKSNTFFFKTNKLFDLKIVSFESSEKSYLITILKIKDRMMIIIRRYDQWVEVITLFKEEKDKRERRTLTWAEVV